MAAIGKCHRGEGLVGSREAAFQSKPPLPRPTPPTWPSRPMRGLLFVVPAFTFEQCEALRGACVCFSSAQARALVLGDKRSLCAVCIACQQLCILCAVSTSECQPRIVSLSVRRRLATVSVCAVSLSVVGSGLRGVQPVCICAVWAVFV